MATRTGYPCVGVAKRAWRMGMENTMLRRVGSAIGCLVAIVTVCWYAPTARAQTKHAWFAGTYLDPAIQRPDFLPHTITRSIPEHRQVYNRPWYYGGKIVHIIEPTSQEAMSWETNHDNGNYRNHAGRYMPLYLYPKPWEVINTRCRPGNPDSMIDETANIPSDKAERVPPLRANTLPSNDTLPSNKAMPANNTLPPIVQEVPEPPRR